MAISASVMTLSCDNQVIMPHQPERWITQRWQTARRYYVVEVTQDLFGNWLVKRSWGGLGSHRSNSVTMPANDYKQALKLLEDVAKRRQQRGYVCTTRPSALALEAQ